MGVSVVESIQEYKQNGSLNKEKRSEQMKAYYLKNREKLLVKARVYYKKYYLKNKGKEVARVARWKRVNPELHVAQTKRYYEKLKMIKLRGGVVKRREIQVKK